MGTQLPMGVFVLILQKLCTVVCAKNMEKKHHLTAKGGWTSRGICNWNHATELLKLHNDAKWHKDAAVAARMAEQSASVGSVLDLYTAASAKQAEEQRLKKSIHTSQASMVTLFLGKKSYSTYHYV